MLTRELILEHALALPAADREFVVDALAESLPAGKSDFVAELQRRSAAYRAGLTTARTAKDVLSELRRSPAHESVE